MKIYMILVIFLLLGAFFIVSEKNISLNSKDNVVEFGKLYLNWLDQVFGNIKHTTGYLVRLEWLPANQTSEG